MAHFVQTNNIQLHYLSHPGEGPTLVLLPGLTANAHAFDGLIQAGLSPRYRVLALDLRGRGLTDKPTTGYSMADHAADSLFISRDYTGRENHGVAFLYLDALKRRCRHIPKSSPHLALRTGNEVTDLVVA